MSEEATAIEAIRELLEQILGKTGATDTGKIEEYLDEIKTATGKIEEHIGKIEEHTKEIEKGVNTVIQTLDHPALITPFEDYTVTEGLLLLLLLSVFITACVRMLRGGFSWLRS